jgi:2-(1,2-epoxy-1,2-dihydrophenyl)acetyl-CoA isomerase
MTHIHAERRGPIGVIQIDRPARFNAMDVQTAQDFRLSGLQFARDDTLRVVVLKGLPGVFCSGADLKFIRDGGDADDLGYLTKTASTARGERAASPGPVFKQILEYIHSTISEIRRAPKPFVAAVDGVAAAGGFGIAMACDLVLATPRATFEWAYSKTGLSGAESTTFLLPRLIGLRRALTLMLLNPRLTAAEALDYGLISSVHPADRFETEVMEIAARLADGPPRGLAIAKELLNSAAGMDRLDEHLDRELDELARIADGPEFAEGLSAFFAKRPPLFVQAGTKD